MRATVAAALLSIVILSSAGGASARPAGVAAAASSVLPSAVKPLGAVFRGSTFFASQDARFIVTTTGNSGGERTHLYDTKRERRLRIAVPRGALVIGLSPDARWVVYRTQAGISTLDRATGRIQTVRGFQPIGRSSDGRHVPVCPLPCTSSRRGLPRAGVLDLRSRRYTQIPRAPRGYGINTIAAISSDGGTALYYYDKQNGPRPWYAFSTRTKRARRVPGAEGSGNAWMSFPDGAVVAIAAGPTATTKIYRRAAGTPFSLPFQVVNENISLSRDGRTLAFACGDSILTMSVPARQYSLVASGLPTKPGPNPVTAPEVNEPTISRDGAVITFGLRFKRLYSVKTAGAQALGRAVPSVCVREMS